MDLVILEFSREEKEGNFQDESEGELYDISCIVVG